MKQVVTLILIMVMSVLSSASFAQTDSEASAVGENWSDLMHYALIGNWDLSRGYGEALLALEPNPVLLLDLAEDQRYVDSYRNLALLKEDSPLKDVAEKVLAIVEQGRFMRRTNADRISAEVKRLSGTTRGRMLALDRLKDSGEWAVPIMIQAMRNPSRMDELANIRWALPQLGKPAVNPLVVVLQQCRELNIRLIVADALAKIGYESALPYFSEIVEDENVAPDLKNEAANAIRTINGKASLAGSAASQFEQLGENFYNHLPSLAVPADQDFANVWFWDDDEGLFPEEVDCDVFDELMAMRCCENAVSLDSQMTDAIALWLSAFFRLEAEGFDQPAYFGQHHADAGTYALTAGPEYLHRVLSRALQNCNRPVALSAIQALQRNAGQQSLLYQLKGKKPLVCALSFPDREIRFSAALAIGAVLPNNQFEYSEQVVPILAESLRQQGRRYAIVVDSDSVKRNRFASELIDNGGFTEVVNSDRFATALEAAKGLASYDLLVVSHNVKQPDINGVLDIIKKDYRLTFCPTIILCSQQAMPSVKKLSEADSFVRVLSEIASVEEVLEVEKQILADNQARPFAGDLADSYAEQTADVLKQLAITNSAVLNVAVAEDALLESVYDERKAVQDAAVETLARMDSVKAQRMVGTLALDDSVDLPTRFMALRALAVSAKAFGNLLGGDQIDRIYSIVSSLDVNVELRNLCAEAYGALDLSSAKISQLIIDQKP